MNYKLDVASLIVDPKGFPLKELHLPTGGIQCEPGCSEQRALQHISHHLLRNWVLYEPADMVELDFCLGELSQLLNRYSRRYRQLRRQPQTAQAELHSLQLQLEEALKVLVGSLERAQFYEIPLEIERMYRSPNGIGCLLLECDDFRVMAALTDVLRLLQESEGTRILVEDDYSRAVFLADAFLDLQEFTGGLSLMFEEGWQPKSTLFRSSSGCIVNLCELAYESDSTLNNILKFQQRNQVSLSELDRAKCWLYANILRHKGDVAQLRALLRVAANLCEVELLGLPQHLKHTVFTQAAKSIVGWCRYGVGPAPELRLIGCGAYSPELASYLLKPVIKLPSGQLLNCINGCYLANSDLQTKQRLEQLFEQEFQALVASRQVMKYSEQLFQLYHNCQLNTDELFRYFMLSLQELLSEGNDCSGVDVLEFEKGMMHFFRWFLSEGSPSDSIYQPFYKHIVNPTFLSLLRAKMDGHSLNSKQRRIYHFLFNQSLYFCLQLTDFEPYFNVLLAEPDNLRTAIWLMRRFGLSNQLMFKMNFKYLHRMVQAIYARNEETHLRNIDTVQLYWETAAKFLLLWGARSYLQQQTDSLKQHYDYLLAKIIDLVPQLNRVHRLEEEHTSQYLSARQEYHPRYMQCWLNFLSFKQQTFYENTLFAISFVRDELPQNHIKSLLRFSLTMCTPLTVCKFPNDSTQTNQQQSLFDDIDYITSEFAIEALECVQSVLQKWKKPEFSKPTELTSLLWKQFWLEDRRPFVTALTATSELTVEHYQGLRKLRCLENYIQLYVTLMEKLNEQSRHQFDIIAQIEQEASSVCMELWQQLWQTTNQACVDSFYDSSQQLKELSDNKAYQQHYLSMLQQVDRQFTPTVGGFQCFERQHIQNNFRFFRLARQLFDNTVRGNSALFTRLTEKRIGLPLSIDISNRPPAYRIIGRCIELIRTIENYFVCTSEQEKKIKCREFVPLQLDTIKAMTSNFNMLTMLIAGLSQPDTYVTKLGELLLRQLKKYFTGFLLHDLLQNNVDSEETIFDKTLEVHMNLHLSLLSFASTIYSFYEDTHSTYIEVLDAYVNGSSLRATPSNTSLLPRRKKHVCKLILSVFNLFLYSTFKLTCRVRSALFHQLISFYGKLSNTPKRVFNSVILYYLQLNFQRFIEFSLTEEMKELAEGDVTGVDRIDPMSIPRAAPIKTICTQAMVINLLSRNNFETLVLGIKCIFANSKGVDCYLRYLIRVAAVLVDTAKLDETDLETIVLDVFGSLQAILEPGLEQTNHERVLTMLVQIMELLAMTNHPLGEVKNNIAKHLTSLLFAHPTEEVMKKVDSLSNESSKTILAVVRCQYRMAKECRSRLHLLNCLYLDMTSMRFVRENWPAVIENFSQEQAAETAKSIFARVADKDLSDFLAYETAESSLFQRLVLDFVVEFEEKLAQRGNEQSASLCNKWRVVLGLVVKLPSLWGCLTNRKVVDDKSFLQYMLMQVLRVNYFMVAEFVFLLLKTNGGFQLNQEGVLLSHNFILSCHVLQILSDIVSNPSGTELQHYLHAVKLTELVLCHGREGLFGLYLHKSPARLQEKVVECHRLAYRYYSSQLLQHTIKCLEKQPQLARYLMSLLDILLRLKLEQANGFDVRQNITYFNNKQILQALRAQNSQPLPQQQIVFNENCEKINTTTQIPSYTKCRSTNQSASNLFVNRKYNLLSADDRQCITKQSRQLNDIASELVSQSKLSRKLYGIHESLFRALLQTDGEDDIIIEDAKLSVPSLEDSAVEEDSSQERFFQQDTFIMPTSDDAIVDDVCEDSSYKQLSPVISSFEQLHDECDQSDTIGQLLPAQVPRPSLANLPSDQKCSLLLGFHGENNEIQVLFQRVQKMDLMNDLEMGLDISNKIQFLSNDELGKMISVSDGRLLMALQIEKQKRGLSTLVTGRVGQDSPSPIRYLDQLYIGCRNNPHVQEMLTGGHNLVPRLCQGSLISLLNEYLDTDLEKASQEVMRKVLVQLCLNSHNLCVVANLSLFILYLNEKQLKLLEAHSVSFLETTKAANRRPNKQSEVLPTMKSRILILLSELFEERIGLHIWLSGEFSTKLLRIRGLSAVKALTRASNHIGLPAQDSYRLIDIVLRNVVAEKLRPIESYSLIVQSMQRYVQTSEKRHSEGYPYFLIEERQVFHEKDIQIYAAVLLRDNLRASKGTFHNDFLRLLLQVYPNCYEPLMTQFIRQLGEELRILMESSLKQFRQFRATYGLRPEVCHEINSDKERLSQLVDSYLLLCKEKDNGGTEALLDQLRNILYDICFDVVPWFKEWRFQVENRTETYEFGCSMEQLKKQLTISQLANNFEEVERIEQQKLSQEMEFASFKCKKVNEFLTDFLRPVHEAVSVGLLNGFVKAQELLDMMITCFVPSAEQLTVVAPAYKRMSSVWQAVVAFGSLNAEQESNCSHTMSNLQTRQILKSRNEVTLKSSTMNLDVNKQRRRSAARLSIATTNPYSIDKIVQKFLKYTEVMAGFIEQGSRLTPMLSKHGGLQVKLKTIRRRKSGTVKEIEIDREKVWFDTLMAIDSEFVNKDVRIKFKNELGVDYGGLTKEWLTIITKELFNPMFGLFQLSANRLTLQPSRLSYLVPNHLMHFRKLGVLVGKALIEGWNMEINFTKSFLKHLLGCTIYVEDLQDIDPQTCKSLMWILENEVDESMEINFSYTTYALGEVKNIELCEDGQNVFVDESNKKNYVKALCKAKMTDQIREQSKAFMQGLESVIPYSVLKNISYKELGLYLAGMPTINIAQMKQHAQYHGFGRSDKVVEWFWHVLQDFDQETIANFLFFLTGSFKVPYGGFKDYPVVLNRISAKDHLPVAHTCFNTLDLSDYSDRKTLAAKLQLSINEGRGFNVS